MTIQILICFFLFIIFALAIYFLGNLRREQSSKRGQVRIMRSHDYCHFEMTLPIGDDECADEVRKDCARLVDKAVDQFIRRKEVLDMKNAGWRENNLKELAAEAEKTPEESRTPGQKAEIKAYADYQHWKSRDFSYDYDSDDRF